MTRKRTLLTFVLSTGVRRRAAVFQKTKSLLEGEDLMKWVASLLGAFLLLGGPNVTSFLVDLKTGTLTANTGQTLPVPPRKLAAAPGGGTCRSGCCVYVIPDPSANTAGLFAFSINKFNGALTLAPNQPSTLL